VLWLLLAVPTLVLGPLWKGGSLVVHEHSEVGEHVHVFSETAHEHHEEHAAQHELEHEAAERLVSQPALAKPERERVHLLMALPGPLGSPAASSASPVPSALLPLYATVGPRAPSCQTAPAISGAGPPGRACGEKQRSGVAAVLTTSRAILI
jgi:hypothetical protein